MFKVGDKVRLKYGRSTCSIRHSGPEIRIIKTVFKGHCMLDCCENGAWNDELELILKKELNNEIDYLDAFQSNFKNGV